MVNVYLYPGLFVKNNVRLTDPTTPVSGMPYVAPFADSVDIYDSITLNLTGSGFSEFPTDSTTPTDALPSFDIGVSGAFKDTETPTDTLARAVGKALSETETPTDANAKAVGKALSETETPTDATVLSPGKVFAETETPTDALTRTIGNRLADTSSPQSAATFVLAYSSGITFVWTAAYGLQPVGTLTISDSSTPTDTLALGVVVADQFADETVPTDAQPKVVHKTSAETETPTDAQAKAVSKPIAENTTPSDSVNPVLNGGGSNFTLGLSETETPTDSIRSSVVKNFAEIETPSDARNLALGHTLTLSLSDALSGITDNCSPVLNALALGTFYSELNRVLRQQAATLTTPIIFGNELGTQTTPYIAMRVEIVEDRQVTFPSGHEARGYLVLNVVVSELKGDREGLRILDNIYNTFRRLTAEDVRFQPPRIGVRGKEGSHWKYECRVPFSKHV